MKKEELIAFPESEARAFIAALKGGEHHICGQIKPFGPGWSYCFYGDLATFDFDALTRLVFLAHDRCIRVSLGNGGPRHIKIMLHKRARTGPIMLRHPVLEEAFADWRKYNAAEPIMLQKAVPV